jgi:hypothetical protein
LPVPVLEQLVWMQRAVTEGQVVLPGWPEMVAPEALGI